MDTENSNNINNNNNNNSNSSNSIIKNDNNNNNLNFENNNSIKNLNNNFQNKEDIKRNNISIISTNSNKEQELTKTTAEISINSQEQHQQQEKQQQQQQQRQQQHHNNNYIMVQYHVFERFLKNFVHDGMERWHFKIQQIKDIIKELYKNPIDLNFSDLNIGIDEESLYSSSSSDKLLNTYSLDELEKYFEQFGIKKQLSERGYINPKIIIDFTDPFVHRLEITDIITTPSSSSSSNTNNSDNEHTIDNNSNNNTSPDINKLTTTTSNQHILVDMFIRRKEIYVYELLNEKKKHDNNNNGLNGNNGSTLDGSTGPPPTVDPRYIPNFKAMNGGHLFEWKDLKATENVLKQIDYPIKATVIEWLCLQDPSKVFSEQRPPLPGQLYPGLGVTKQINNLLVHLATIQFRDCLLNKPFRFYNAFFYQTREYFYIDPSIQAIFLSLLNDLEEYLSKFGLAPISWAFEFGCVKEKSTGNIVKWEFHKQLRPISTRMKNYFKSKLYTQSVQENMRPLGTFYIDWNGHPSLSHFCNNNNNNQHIDNSNSITPLPTS